MVRFNLITVTVLFLLMVSTDLFAQDAVSLKIATAVEKYKKLNPSLQGEKVYLHLDRPDYVQGDTIWFKAYSWYGYDQEPDTVSGVLHVDLISPEGKIKQKRKLLIENGASHGDFCLDTTITPGRYTLRAYTRRMQNLNCGEPFYQTVTINPASENFHVECTPAIIKRAGADSLQVTLRYFELDKNGDLKDESHRVNYSVKIGERRLENGERRVETGNRRQDNGNGKPESGEILAANGGKEVFKCLLPAISENDSVAELSLSINDEGLTFWKQFQISLRERINLQFFPEGGRLVNGVESRVAFKAIGTDGLSREVKGEIRDDGEKVITGFESSHKGMGIFLLKSEAGKKYFAHLRYNNRMYVIPLPAVSEEGSTMSVSYPGSGGDPYLTIKQKYPGTSTQKYVVGSAYGKIWFTALVRMAKDSCRLLIPRELLPEGICRLTVLDGDFKPECERLVYSDKKERFKIQVKPDSSSYGTRSKVTLLIKAAGPDGEPLQTDLSLAVVDKEQVTGDNKSGGISAYKLLESELKGSIEDACFYFKGDSCNHAALDLLLLTQGYRRFLSDTIPAGKLRFKPEKNLEVSGKITLDGSKSRERKFNYRDVGLILMCGGGNLHLDRSKPDSVGRFSFRVPIMYGRSSSLLQVRTAKGKKFYGSISIDPPPALPHFPSPVVTTFNTLPTTVEYVHSLQKVRKTEKSKIDSGAAWHINLKEVMVTAKAKDWYLDFEPQAKKIAKLDSLDPSGNKYESIYDLLIREFGAEWYNGRGMRTIVLPCVKTMGRGMMVFFPIYVINGKTYWNGEGRDLSPLETLSALHVNEIKKVMVLPPMIAIVMNYSSLDIVKDHIYQSMVVIETYSNNSYRGDAQGIKTFVLNGLDTPRVFYSPRYDKSSEDPIYDGRATLFWDPSLRTDSKGEAKVEFYTSDRKTNLEVIVNGIEIGTGIPGEGKTEIKMKE